ncbi:hypothetical protein QTP70_023316 [Hemibagrus guttatus]|uniref:Centriolar and ciliogenesis-associated protein HYLS1 C-terminal domain-containing protein n=1 Tax=Hemibagrus guttatus TaxID=175788 RepID=A0AAE0V172_9TELE|nr:hypothetical protein QTP70_023316 [Hemibagrus guttatus]KAK3561978.1 hypothetical protein QTP86_022360 [Hemibagrus guttatus]
MAGRNEEMEDLDFSEEEIQEQLAALGYGNIPKQRLHEFKRDLDLLIRHEKSKSSTSAEWSSPKSHSSSCKSPPAFTKEKVQVPSAASKYNCIYSGNRAADQRTQVLTSTFNDENYDSMILGPCDSYIKHTVAPRCIRPSTAPNRLEVEDSSSDIYPSVLGASEPVRLQRDTHTNAEPALKRKVLRKHRGHSQVCDESTYSEDSVSKKGKLGMYKTYYSYTYEEDNESLSSSFWTDQESEDPGECYVKDARIETELGIYKQEVNTENKHCVKDDTVNEQTGEKLNDRIKEDDMQYYVKEQSEDEDSGKLRDEQVIQHNDRSVKIPGKENEKRKICKSGTEGKKSDYIKKGCAGEEMPDSEHLMRETGNEEAQSKKECDADKEADENSEEEQIKCFVHDKNVSSEESESDDLESDEEIEYFASESSQGVTKGEEPEGEKFERDDESETFFGYQDDISEPVRNDERTCAEGGLMEQYPESSISFVAEQHSEYAVDSADEVDQMYTKHRENNGSTEQIWMYSPDAHETGVYEEDYHGSTSSLTASILTSGYGTYKPDSPKDEADVRNDCDLSELELGTECTQDDPNLSWYRDWLSSDVAEQQIPSVSLIRDDWSPFDSLIAADSCVYNSTDIVRGTTHENRLRSSTLCPEHSQRLPLSVESVELPAREEKATCSVHHQVTRTNNQNVTFSSEDWEDVKTFPVCNNEAFDTRERLEPVSELEERIAQHHVSVPHDWSSESEETSGYSDRHSSAMEDLPSAFRDYIKGMTRSHSENDLRPRPKSFIRPVMDHPHTRNLKKTDPVAKYFQYKQDWEMFKPPGEKRRNELHWAIREQLAYQPPPPKPQKTYIPNTYVVPTEKKRSALRWEIRHDLANGIIPAKVTYM